MPLLKRSRREKHYQPSLQISEQPVTEDLVPRTKVGPDTGHSAPIAKSIWSHAFSLVCVPALKRFVSLPCLNITTWVVRQHCVQLHQQLPSLITPLTLAFHSTSTRERRERRTFHWSEAMKTLSDGCGLPQVTGWAGSPGLPLASASVSAAPCFPHGPGTCHPRAAVRPF